MNGEKKGQVNSQGQNWPSSGKPYVVCRFFIGTSETYIMLKHNIVSIKMLTFKNPKNIKSGKRKKAAVL